MAGKPLLSVVAVIVSDTVDRNANVSHLEPCLKALSDQRGGPAMEIIVPYYPPVNGIDALGRMFPKLRFVPIPDLKTHAGPSGGREHHDELRARGMALAQGDLIALIEDHGIAGPGWSASLVRSHQQPYAAVGGAIENGVDRALNWAVYFCDFLRYQNPLPQGEVYSASDANISYKRQALEKIRPVWQEIFHETAVNTTLLQQGEKIALDPGMIVYQQRRNLRLGTALKERFIWGRSYAGTRVSLISTGKRLILAALSPLVPAVILLRMFQTVLQKGRSVGVFLKVLPFTALLSAGWAIGEMTGYLTGKAHQAGSPAGEAIARGSHAGE